MIWNGLNSQVSWMNGAMIILIGYAKLTVQRILFRLFCILMKPLRTSTPRWYPSIVTGERRKAKEEQASGEKKKKYRKKSPDAVRLCVDDVMSRVRLKEYQNSYAEQMAKYGLQRGIDGSEARHISTQQYYKELANKSEA